MIFEPLAVEGAYLIKSDRYEDERGYFSRAWCQNEYDDAGLPSAIVQSSLSFNYKAGTLRGMHFQLAPHAENKIVRCLRGKMYDVILDLRPNSETYLRHVGIELSPEASMAVFVPSGCAHGFITLSDDTEVLYMMDEFYHSESSAGVRWNDPSFDIEWPIPVEVINDRDAQYPDYDLVP